MLTKRTAKNEITLPEAIVARFTDTDYFDVSTDGVSITLKPLLMQRADPIRNRLADLGIAEQDVSDAVEWARSGE